MTAFVASSMMRPSLSNDDEVMPGEVLRPCQGHTCCRRDSFLLVVVDDVLDVAPNAGPSDPEHDPAHQQHQQPQQRHG